MTITLKSRTPARAAIDAWLYGPKGLIIDEERKPIQMTKTYELVEVSNECKE